MSVTSTSAAGAAPASGGIDPISPEQANARAVTGFELLLADAQSPQADSSTSSNSDHSGSNSSSPDGTTAAATDSPAAPPPAKPAAEGDPAGLLGALGAPMTPPVAIPDPPVPPATNPTDSAPVTDVTAAPEPTVLDLVAAALTPDPSASDVSPADPATTPAVATDLSALLEQAPRPAAAATPPVDYAPSTPSASATTAGGMTAKDSSPTPANASARPNVVDSAGPAPSDRPHLQSAASSAPSGAATFAPPPAATAATAPTADEWTAATATVAPPPPAEQLVSVLSPLRTSPTGSYTLRLELKPPEMGRVEMRVEMRDGVLHASIHAEREGAAQLVRDSISDLRDRLNAEGVRTGDLTVSDGGVGPGSREGEDGSGSRSTTSGPAGASSDDPALPTPLPDPFSPETASLLDVRV